MSLPAKQVMILALLFAALISCDRQEIAPAAGQSARQPMKIALPAFNLTDQTGQAFSSVAALQGKVWIANFIFTRCAGPCPALTAQFYLLQEKLKTHPKHNDIRLVTFTVDPEYDTPPILAKRADIAHADPEMWRWLTGQRQPMWQLIEKGFLLPVGENKEDVQSPIIHSQKFVLVDQSGMIRGYYDGLDDESCTQLKRDLNALLK